MDVTQLPFNKFIGLKFSDRPAYLLMLDNQPEFRNHLDTVHARLCLHWPKQPAGISFWANLQN